MADKKINAKTLMSLFFAVVLVSVLGVWIVSALATDTALAFDGSLVNGGNYTGIFPLNISYSSNSSGATGINITCFYNSSGGDVFENYTSSGDISGVSNLTEIVWNNSDGNISVFVRNISISGLTDSRTYNISCVVNNGTNKNWTSVTNVTFDSTPPGVNFSDTTSNVTNNGYYSTALKCITINVTAIDALLSAGFGNSTVYINFSHSNGSQMNFTRALNNSLTTNFYNTSFNVSNVLIFPDGKYNITIYANDSMNDSLSNAQNLNNSERIQITLDRTAPSSVTLTQSTSTTTTQNVVTIAVVDATSEINNCEVDWSEGATITGTGSSTQTLTHTGLNCGTSYSYIITCWDQAGNSLATESTSFSTSSCSSGDSTSSGGGTTTSTIVETNVLDIAFGTAAVVSNFEEDMGIKQIKLWVKEIASGVKITTKKFNTQPAEITVQKTGQVHKYLQITTQNLETKLSKAVITIKVQKNWLLNNDIDKANIAMFKLNEVVGKWNELPTVYKEEDATYYYYDIEVDSFSYFAIGEKAIVEEEEEEEPEARNLLWLWITIGVVVLIVIFGGSVLAKRKR